MNYQPSDNNHPQYPEYRCSTCGNPIPNGGEACPNCGTSVFPTSAFAPPVNKKSNSPKVLICVLVGIFAIILAIILISILKPTPEELMAEANYTEAYENADMEQKDDILAEHAVAFLSYRSSELLKDPSSFELRAAYCRWFINEEDNIVYQVVLHVAAANSYGAKVSSYMTYTLDSSHEWSFWGAVSDFEIDSSDEVSDMMAKIIADTIVKEGQKLSKEQTNRINALFNQDLLYTVVDIDWDTVDTSNFSRD